MGCTVRYACSPLGCVRACVVYGRFDSRFDSNEKNDSQVPRSVIQPWKHQLRQSLCLSVYNRLATTPFDLQLQNSANDLPCG